MLLRGLLLCAMCAPLLYSEEALVDLSMTPQDREAIGVDRFNSQQKKALERWLEAWTRTVITHAPSYHTSQSLPQWISMWRQEQQRKKINEEEAPETAVHTLYRNRNGEVLELADGSIWDIVVIDQFTASMWKRGNQITIMQAKLDIARPYILFNVSRNEQAGAKLQRPPSPDGKRPKEPPSYYAGSFPIEMIGVNSSSVTLQNGKRWSIAPLDQVKVQNNWRVQDRIRVTKNNDVHYPDKLNNLDSGDSVAGIAEN